MMAADHLGFAASGARRSNQKPRPHRMPPAWRAESRSFLRGERLSHVGRDVENRESHQLRGKSSQDHRRIDRQTQRRYPTTFCRNHQKAAPIRGNVEKALAHRPNARSPKASTRWNAAISANKKKKGVSKTGLWASTSPNGGIPDPCACQHCQRSRRRTRPWPAGRA